MFRFAATADTVRTYPGAGTSRRGASLPTASAPVARHCHSFTALCHLIHLTTCEQHVRLNTAVAGAASKTPSFPVPRFRLDTVRLSPIPLLPACAELRVLLLPAPPTTPRHDAAQTERTSTTPPTHAQAAQTTDETQGEWIPTEGQWPVDPQEDVEVSEQRIWVDGCFDFAHHGMPTAAFEVHSAYRRQAMRAPCCRRGSWATSCSSVCTRMSPSWRTRARR